MKVSTLALLAAIVGSSCGGPSSVPKWEYTIASPADSELQERLKILGASGWEIISARRATSSEGGRTAASYELILKRPISEQAAASILAAPPVPK